MNYYLRLRLRVLGRLFRELGWGRLLVLGMFLALATGQALFTAAASPALVWLVPVAVGSLVLSLHRRRADLPFLRLSAPGFRAWLAVEYVLLSLPVALVLLGRGRPAAAGAVPLLAALAALAALAPAATAGAGRGAGRSWFRSVAFEWVSLGRRWWLGLGWLALLAAAGATRATATGPALAVVGWLLLLLDAYGPAEPLTWLLPVLVRPTAWLRSRIGWAFLYFGLTAAPLAFLMAQSPAGLGGTLALLLWCALVLTMLVLAKYAFYPHATLSRLTQAGAVVVAVSILGSNPAYLALLVACLLGLILKSRRQLSRFVPAAPPENTAEAVGL
ncbi:hypothetical protein [Hymenobacter swuensis]|uniref:Uncharacterized protein n=1 Tax=Hymenobacter swuensis DY53 TaxID=1227739 RepID=W8EZN9_9BACT|nr:hypothetical protein [Hymenobacter swuensis]AHJ98103.1 hypothetical protein Hsw_2508 [Hymenobacter swuensis DY53]